MNASIGDKAPKLGLIAGGGDLPIHLAEHCRASGRPYTVFRLRGFADARLASHPGHEVGMAELGRQFQLLRLEGCKAVCFAGNVQRPDFSRLKPDLRGITALPGAIAAAAKGDDALLRYLIHQFEQEGYLVEGADQVGIATLPSGALGSVAPGPEHEMDICLAVKAAQALGALDIGQAAAVARGVVLAVEAQEGTDALLRRCAELPQALRGTPDARVGVLAKWPKSIQERRVDLPTLGARTVIGAAEAGFAGIVAEAGGALIIDALQVKAAADELGLFVFGLEQSP